jgi:hypothetical protein
VVLLGEIRSANAIPTLIEQLQRTDEEELAEAAAEGLAKIGVPSVAELSRLVTAPDPVARIYVYAALSGICNDRAFSALTDALDRDPELGFVVAQALSDQGRREAIPLLYEGYIRSEPWQRAEFEEAIQDLHFGRAEAPLRNTNWRARYRRDPSLGGYRLGWLGISVVLQKNRQEISSRKAFPVRPLEELLAAGGGSGSDTCEDCGGPVEYPTGLPVCPETAVDIALTQARFLGHARESGAADVYEILDAIDERLSEHYEQDPPLKARAREGWKENAADLKVEREICQWLIEQGIDDIGAARDFLLAKASELADRFGDPEGLLSPVNQTRKIKVGRNDLCPCGSGKKYKRCCLGKS